MSTDTDRKLPIVPIILVVVVIVLLALAWWQGGAAPRAEVTQLNTELVQTHDAQARAEMEREEIRATLTLREAQVALLEANMELDRRNFGIANQHIERAAERLGEINAETLSLDATLLESLREELAGTNLNLATDLAEQRAQLTRLAGEIHDLATDR